MTPYPVEDPAAAGGHVEIDRCESCGGSFFEFFDGEPIRLASETLQAAPPGASRPVSGAPICSDCGQPMERRRYLDQGPELARCESCMALFVSATELEELAGMRLERDDAPRGWLAKLMAWVRRV